MRSGCPVAVVWRSWPACRAAPGLPVRRWGTKRRRVVFVCERAVVYARPFVHQPGAEEGNQSLFVAVQAG